MFLFQKQASSSPVIQAEMAKRNLKVGSCPNDDNFVQIFFLSFFVL